jgi:hypothetical protein
LTAIFGQVLPNISIQPPPEYLNKDSICDIYEKLAIQDFENEEFNWGSIGLSFGYLEFENYDAQFNQFFENYLTSKHNLRTINYGCLSFNHEECYNNILDSLIIAKLGKNFFDNELNTAKKLYSDWKGLKIQTKDIFDWSKTYYVVDSPVKLNGNDKELKIYPIKLNAHSIELEIDTNGYVISASILKETPLERIYDNDLAKELNNKFEWVPAYLYGNKVKSTYWIDK